MIWLLYGADGWIGNKFFKLLSKNPEDTVVKGKARCDSVEDLEKEIQYVHPSHIICTIGRTHGGSHSTIDYLEGGPERLTQNIRDNLFGPLMLADICKRRNIHLTYMGTGCIYSDNEFYQAQGGARETDLPNFFGSSYSVVKGYTDRLMRCYNTTVLNLRIRMPIDDTDSDRNLINKIIKYKHVHATPNSMSVLPELLPVAIDMARKRLTGPINFCNPGAITHPEILELYKKYIDPEFEYEIIDHAQEQQYVKAARSNIVLNTDRLTSLYPHIKPIRESVEDLFRKQTLYTPRKLLVTGGCGFIGSNFINHIHKKYPGMMVVNIDKLDYCSNVDNVYDQSAARYKFYHYDLTTDYNNLVKILADNEIDTIVHFAAQSHVTNSFGNSLQFTLDNILGTHNLLEAARIYGEIGRFIHVSTDEVYGEVIDNKSKHEGATLDPTNPYSASKAGAEFMVKAYHKSFKMPIIITRGNNVYGPNQYPEKLIPRFIKLLRENKKMTIEGSGQQQRTFVYVDDVCEAFDLIMRRGLINEIYNIGSTHEYTVLEIADKLCKLIKGVDTNVQDWIIPVPDRNFNDFRYFIESDKLELLGWSPKIDLDTGLELLLKE